MILLQSKKKLKISIRKILKAIGKKISENIEKESLRFINGGIILALFLEITDSISNKKTFYYEDIYKSAKMSQARKIMENLQTHLIDKFSDILNEENYPQEDEVLNECNHELKERLAFEIKHECFNDLKFVNGIKFIQNTKNSVDEFLEGCKRENDEASRSMADDMVEIMLDQVTKIEDIPSESLKGDMIFENLENLFMDLLGSYYSDIRGPFKGKF